ncbi:hypothetical protein Moror_15930 [Moniliophthora roreri MCA 2997]|uniref:F-box domain-containing protein n=1 Tax=Moniliophthora roreri (strain MCA 2997) TaxID=1381753 RepID=V2XGB0_MONRO|nr:hypothetical protein Moror_15930 [Moniliophthora roreri MCA 2997]
MLPPELLLMTFQYFCDSQINVLRSRSRSPTLTIAHVSSGWRTLVRSTPYLWANFEVECICSHPNAGHILSHFLLFSSDALLSFRFIHQNDIGLTQCHEGLVVTQLVQSAHRWKEASFSLPWYMLPSIFNRITSKHDLSALQSLRIENTKELSEFWVLTTSAQFPSLRKLEIDGVRFGHLRSQISSGLLEALKADPIDVKDVLEVISESPKLHHVDVVPMLFLEFGSAALGEAVRSTSITTFTVHLVGSTMDDLFVRLTLPSLTSLQLIGTAGSSVPVVNVIIFIEFFTRSACHLTHFTLKYSQFEDLSTIFTHIPTLTHLAIYESVTPYTPILRNALLDLMSTSHWNQELLLPALRVLELVLVPACAPNLFTRVIQSRWRVEGLRGCARLERLSLKILQDGRWNPESKKCLEVMRDEGLDFTFE